MTDITEEAPSRAAEVEAAATELKQFPMDKLARLHRKMQARIQEITREMEAKIEEVKRQQDAVDMAIKDIMLASGAKSVKTADGTVILGEKTRFYAQDWDAFKEFVKQRDALDLLEKRIAQRNMAQFLEDNPGDVPPGLNSTSEYTVSVRKPT
jgi:hypothetical protein